MITLFVMALVGMGITFAAVPVVAFALMLETCAERGATPRETVVAARGSQQQPEMMRLASAA